MDVSSDQEQQNPKLLNTLACSARFPDGNTLLHQFVLKNSGPNGSVDERDLIAVLRSMSDYPGSAINAVNCDGYTALHLSVLNGNLLMVKGMLSCLRNIDVNAKCGGDSRGQETVNYGSTALHLAAKSGNLGIVEELCNKGAAIDVLNKKNYTALFIAAKCGRLDAMKLLVSTGADVNTERVAAAEVPLGGAASRRRNLEAVKYLLRCGADVNPRGKRAPLSFAVKSGDAAIVEFLMSNGALVSVALLFYSVVLGRTEIVECFLRSGVDVNAKDKQWLTPLHCVVRWGKSVKRVKFLLDRGADANARDKSEETPLHFAVECGRSVKMVTLLLDRGADANARDYSGKTPLHYAAEWGRSELVTLLLDRGADANARDRFNVTPLHCAVSRRNLYICDFIGDLVTPDAVRRENFEMAELLLEQAADLRAIDEEGRTPLHDAVCGKNDIWIRDYDEDYRERAKVIRTLLEKGADMNARDIDGKTPLEAAEIDLKWCEASIVQHLQQYDSH